MPIDPEPADGAPAAGRFPGIPPEAARVLADLGVGRLAVEEDQDQVLAWELEAFPAEDEPVWEDPDAAPDDDDGWLADLPGEVLADYLAATGAAEPVGPAELITTGIMASPPADVAPPPVAPPAVAPPAVAPPAVAPPAVAAPPPPAADADDCFDASTRSAAGFVHGGTADTMAPGSLLVALADHAWQNGLGILDDDQLTGVLQAWQRIAARAAAGQFAAISELAARREAEAQASGDWRAFEHVEDEIALTLTLTRPGAARVLDLTLALDRLPLTRAALAAGAIDERRAAVIADELTGLDDEHAAAVEALIIGKAAEQTTGQLRPAVHRAVIAADPSAAKRRKEEALKEARVETYTAPSGTATMAGRDLPPAEVLAADKYLTALAKAMKKLGAQDSMNQLRARAYLHLLGGGTPGELVIPPHTTPTTPRTGTGTRTHGTGTPGTGTPGTGTPGTGTPGTGAPGTGTGTTETGTPGSDAAPGPGLPALRGTVNLTMPLAVWLGWSQSPGQVPGFGTLDADDSRALAARLAHDSASKWCVTLTDAAGRPVAHGCAKHGPGPGVRSDGGLDPEPDHGPRPRAGPGPDPGPDHGPGPRAGPGPDPGPDHGPGPRAGPGPDPGPDHGPGPRAGPGSVPPGDHGWLRAVTIAPLQAGICTHPRETPSYRPSAALRHLIEIRQATCARPGCRRAATACDLDHTVPYHLGGRTCECELGPICRHDHRLKQAPGWTLTQSQPGHMTWTTPSGRRYTTGPTSYPD